MLQWVANSDAEISSQWPWPIDTHNGYNPQSRFHLKPQVPGCAGKFSGTLGMAPLLFNPPQEAL